MFKPGRDRLHQELSSARVCQIRVYMVGAYIQPSAWTGLQGDRAGSSRELDDQQISLMASSLYIVIEPNPAQAALLSSRE